MPDLPMLHPHFRQAFTWGGLACAVHPQRKHPGSLRLHHEWFYLELPDGSYHEVQYSRLVSHLEHRPILRCTTSIAMALEKESHQTPEKLRELARLCGL